MSLFHRLTAVALLLCLVVVVLGAYVRLSDAGLGCPDWPGCYGHLTVPTQAEHVEQAQQEFPGRPVEHAKAWKEMIHRYAASTLGLLILALAALSFRAGMPRVLPRVLVVLVIFQGLLGMWTVTWLLKPLAVTAHLLGGMATLALLFWLWLDTRPAAVAAAPRPPRARRFAGLALALLAGQIFLGGWTSSNYAALACPDLPTCQGRLWPELDVGEAFTLWRGLEQNYEYGVLDNRARVIIHHLHRVGALVVSAFLLALGSWLWRHGGAWRRHAQLILALLAVQAGIGVGLVLLHLPLPRAAAHNAGAARLWLAVIHLNQRAWKST
ncbi:MAG: COX15/CtaA family protein [Gammaproteobacteria bacterium]